MRPSRILVLGLAGLVGLHVFMLAGHGRSHDVPMAAQMGQSPMGAYASPSGPPSPMPDPPPPTGHHDAGMAMTVACLAVLAGLLLLLPGRHGGLVTERPPRPTAIWAADRAGAGRRPDAVAGGAVHLPDVSRSRSRTSPNPR